MGVAVLAFRGGTGQPAGHPGDEGEGDPVRTHSRTVPLTTAADGAAAALGSRDTPPFSVLGVTWAQPSASPAGTVEVRTRSAVTRVWSHWRTLDADSGPGEQGADRGGTDPVWVGESDGVEARVSREGTAPLPAGLRLDMIDPGTAVSTRARRGPGGRTAAPSAERPPIASRADWGADESISPEAPAYLPGGKVGAAVVHHTVDSNDYTCDQAPAVIRGVYAYHVKQLGWKDIGYNFLVDKCGTLYEGRKGGVDRPVLGAHAYGFNSETTGIAVLGTHTDTAPPKEAVTALARLAGWKLGLDGADPAGQAALTAGADGKSYSGASWKKGDELALPVIHGHRDSYNTQCPGDALYGQLATIRSQAAGKEAGIVLP
ncbi:hypothetical protein GCM10010145_13810 [Streptomyces ruber]|uniref:Peptidoglycan recognition protein family domain-containing protein n=2 Tax=Streptomyces TaxID=1883 RepID=A0A918B8Y1_9ACTN|nr:hypothetical protein GCM10010145_13810 [Streptomyces ruber]